MGTHLSTNSVKVIHDRVINSYRSVELEDLKETYKILGQVLRYNERLDANDFEQIASFWIEEDMKKHFDLWRGPNNFVDTFIFLAGSVIFSKGDMKDKCRFIFHLFDFDSSGVMSFGELTVMNLACVRGMKKLAGAGSALDAFLGAPVRSLSRHIYKKMKLEETESITYKEFSKWVWRDSTVMKYVRFHVEETDVTALSAQKLKKLDLIRKRFFEILNKKEIVENKDDFGLGLPALPPAPETKAEKEKKEKEKKGPKGIKTKKFGAEMICLMFPSWDEPEEADIENLVSQLDYHGKMLLPPILAMAAVIQAFFLCDKQGLGRITIGEIKALLWVLLGREPTKMRVDFELKLLDPDHTGFVTQGKWISNHLIDPGTQDAKEQELMRDLKMNFDVMDMDRDSKLNIQGTRDFLFDTLKRNMGKHQVNDEGLRFLQGITAGYAQTLFKKNNLAEHQLLHWDQFKDSIVDMTKMAPKYTDRAFRFQTHRFQKLIVFARNGNVTFNRPELERILEHQVTASVKYGLMARAEAKKMVKDITLEVTDLEDGGIDPETTFNTITRVMKLEKKLQGMVGSNRNANFEKKRLAKMNSRPGKFD